MSSEINELILKELRKISKMFILVHAESIEKELEKIANTDKRKIMWLLIDGKRMSKDIAEVLKVSEEAVNKFLRKLSVAGFATNPKGKPPKRIIDYVPPAWIELLNKLEGGEENE